MKKFVVVVRRNVNCKFILKYIIKDDVVNGTMTVTLKYILFIFPNFELNILK